MEPFLIISVFIAGILTFLAPCTFPLVPGYLAFIGGASLGDLKDPEKARAARRKIFFNGLFYVLGFSVVFIVLGSIIGFVGAAFATYRVWLTRIAGIFVILFGLFMLNVFSVPFFGREKQFFADGKIPFLNRGNPASSFILGSSFAFGWTPCVGPVLGSVLLLASTSTTVYQGAFLLFIFSLGLAVPFLLIAAAVGSSVRYIKNVSKYLKVISIIGGVLLILLGILLFMDRMALLISWGFYLFRFINYERLLDYL